MEWRVNKNTSENILLLQKLNKFQETTLQSGGSPVPIVTV